jgi:hypothetical protein
MKEIKALTKTLKSTSQMPVTGETDEIIIDLSDGKNTHILNYISTLILMYFKENFLYSLQMHYPKTGTAIWTDWTEIPALVDIAKITYFFIGFKNATNCIKY